MDYLDRVEGHLNDVDGKIENISRLTNLINTPGDSQQVRDTLRIERQQCMQILGECNKTLSNLASSAQQIELMNRLTRTSTKLKDIVFFSKSKENNFPLGVAPPPQVGDVRNFVSQSQQAQLMEDDITIVETTELDIHNDIIKSRNESLKRVKEGLEMNREVQKDLGLIIESQNDLLETTLLMSEKNKKISQDALNQMKIAGKKTTAVRAKYCIILAIILGGLLVCAGIIAARIGIYAAAA